MKQIFYGTIMASNARTGLITSKAVVIVAPSEADAYLEAKRVCTNAYPADDGWATPSITIDQLPLWQAEAIYYALKPRFDPE